jgi:hypothetical protein
LNFSIYNKIKRFKIILREMEKKPKKKKGKKGKKGGE